MPGSTHMDISEDGLTSSEFPLGNPASMLGLQFTPGTAVTPRDHTSVLNNQWLPYHNPSSTASRSQPLDYFPCPASRLANNQEAWNPLQVTGVPPQSGALGDRSLHRSQPLGDFDVKYPGNPYSPPSDNGSQYTGFVCSDSGYGTKSRTASSVTTSFAVESTCGSQLALNEYDPAENRGVEPSMSQYGDDPMDTNVPFDSSAFPYPDSVKCDYPGCPWTGKCPSDKRCVFENIYLEEATDCYPESMKRDTGNCSYATSRNAPGRKASGQSTTSRDIRSASITKSRSADQRCYTCVLARTALARTSGGRVWITSDNILRGCTVMKMPTSC